MREPVRRGAPCTRQAGQRLPVDQEGSGGRTGHVLNFGVSEAAVEAVLAEHNHALVVQALHDAVAHRRLPGRRTAWQTSRAVTTAPLTLGLLPATRHGGLNQ